LGYLKFRKFICEFFYKLFETNFLLSGYLADASEAEDENQKVHVTEVDEELLDDSDEHSVLLCRARHNGIVLAGAVVDGKCLVSLAKEVKGYERYDVLRNVQNAARLQWRQWNQYNGRPFGAVSVADDGKIYIARRQVFCFCRRVNY